MPRRLRRLERGDPERATRVLGAALRPIFRKLPPWVDYADVYQDAFVGLLEADRTWNPERGPWYPWVLRRAKGAAWDAMRAHAKSDGKGRYGTQTEVQSLDVPITDHSASGQLTVNDVVRDDRAELEMRRLEHRQRRKDLNLAVRNLPERQRVIMRLIYWRGKSGRYAAQVLGVTESRVSQLHREALRRLEDAARRYDHPEP